MSTTRLAEFEHSLLAALALVGADARGLDLARAIEQRTGRAISPGAIYTGLDRLERRGLVRSRLGDPTPQRGGKRRRLYTQTTAGRRALAERRAAVAEWLRAFEPDAS